MPTYEYECPRCGTFDVEQKITDDVIKSCPNTLPDEPPTNICGLEIKRLISSGTSFVLKGERWGRDGY